MYRIAAGQELPHHRITDLLDGTGVRFVRGAATAIAPEARRVTVEGGTSLSYVTLVYAPGGSTDTGTVTVCGGLTGIEAAAEIAEALERPEVTVRQTAHRARAHVPARRPRFDTGPGVRRQVTDQFLTACAGGDLNSMMELLAPDVVAWSDGGGKVTAARRPLHGIDHVARRLLGFPAEPEPAALTMEPAVINGELGILATIDGPTVGALSFDIADSRMHRLRFQVDPGKLRGLTPENSLSAP
ncbi:hypothetical protein ACFVIY_00735 [Streptomyces sp. NPDC127166]|uniref:hypothetical protein n=1 Tax=Streptomyces sp. NPDC127166 TaxID=3345380 RepID=UPI003631BAD7